MISSMLPLVQLYVKSYELGVLLLPSLLPPTPASNVAATSSSAPTTSTTAGYYAPRVGGTPLPAGAWALPVPYSLPPTRYTPSDIVWSSTDGDRLPRSQTAVRPDRHSRLPGEPSSGHYGPLAIGRVLAEETRRKASSDAKKRKGD